MMTARQKCPIALFLGVLPFLVSPVLADPLEEAIRNNELQRVVELLSEKPWLAKPPSRALFAAAATGNLQLCELLLSHGADPNMDSGAMNVIGPDTPLITVVTSGDFEIAKLFLEHGADPNVGGGRNHDNLVIFAVAYLDLPIVKLMVEHGADVNRPTDWPRGVTPLHVAAALGARYDHPRVFRWGQPMTAGGVDELQALEKLRLLVQSGADVNARASDGSTPLLFAAIAENQAACQLLIDHGAELDLLTACLLRNRDRFEEILRADPALAKSKEGPLGLSPLHCVARSGDAFMTRRLLEMGADSQLRAHQILREDAGGFAAERMGRELAETALHLAAEFGHPEVARLLIEHGADVEAKDSSDDTPLDRACQSGRVEMVRLLLSSGVRMDDGSNDHAFAKAIRHPAIMELLLEASGRPSFADPLGTELLTEATGWNLLEVAAWLIERGAEPDIFAAAILGRLDDLRRLVEMNSGLATAVQQDYPNLSPLELAVQHDQVAVVQWLLERGVEFVPSRRGSRPLAHEAASHGSLEVLKYAMGRGLAPQVTDADGATLLHLAARSLHPDVVRFLLDQGVDVNATDHEGNTPLHEVGWGVPDLGPNAPDDVERLRLVTRSLLEAGANVHARDHQGWTPLHRAAAQASAAFAELLLEAGANINARDNRRETPLGHFMGRGKFATPHTSAKTIADLLRHHGGTH